MSKSIKRLLLIVLAVALSTALLFADDRYLLRFPDIHDDTVVFTWGEDIWSAPADGGIATRLTLHDGQERFPKFSPDGKWIAFTGDYDGNTDVYVMNRYGGKIQRVTYHPGDDTVIGWHPKNGKILFNSRRSSYSRLERLFMIAPDGTGLEELPIHEIANGSFSPDGTKIAYNKVPREFRTWKRYKGGTAQDVYIYDFNTKKNTQITTFRGTDRIPMWIGDTIYFSSDRDRRLNIWAYDTKTEEKKQLTTHKDYDIRRPSDGSGKIVYENGGSLWVLDTTTGKTTEINIQIKADAPETRPYLKKVDKFIQGFDCSPSGERALIVARGEVFTVPAEHGPTRNLTNDSGSRDKDAAWSPDGKMIAYFSDRSGEYQLYITYPGSSTKPGKLTDFKDGYRHTLRFSPDSRKIAFTDQTLTLYYIDIATKKIVKVDKAQYESIDVSLDLKPIYDFAWSPDSRYIAYSKMEADQVIKVFIYSIDTGKVHCVSHGIFNDFGPVFSKDGKHLFFISNRRFNPTFCDFEWEMVYKDVAGIYALTLQKDGEPLLPFRSDEVKTKKSKKESTKKEKKVHVRIDFDGIAERIEMLPLPKGNYRYLSANDSRLFYLNADKGDYNRFEYRALGPQNLCAFSFKDRKEEKVLEGIKAYKLSSDGTKIVYRKDNKIGIIDSSVKDSKGKEISLADLKMWIDPLKEWEQIFHEAWRMERDFYYEENMHGIDWTKMKEKYSTFLPYLACRQDLRFLIGELIGELNTSHTYIYGGDFLREAEKVNIGMLGADWKIDKDNKLYRFYKIYRVPDWSRKIIPPLHRPGIHVKEGDYLLRVNGMDVTAEKNIYSYFQDLAGEQVTVTVNSKPTLKGAKEYNVKPLRSEYILRYLDWVEGNRLKVEKASGGKIGYLHLPDTWFGSAVEFPKYFYAQTRKDGLIIDGRFNAGGLDPDIFLRRLYSEVHSYWTRRYSHDQYSPHLATRANLVCLTNRQAGSGGDELPYEFQLKGLGPVIGTRTWGGLVGVSQFIGMIDGGGLTAPDYRIYNEKGEWVVENVGVTPDIEVDLTPAEMQRGYDAQLMTAVEYLMKKIKTEPILWPKHEPYPVDK